MRQLLDLIGKAEANGNYNAYYGRANNQDNPRLTEMSIKAVRTWQDNFVRAGSKSSAVGKYQIIRKTMDAIMRMSSIPPTALFDEKTQDEMALILLRSRGLKNFLSGAFTPTMFANQLAKEWASFPVVGGPKHGRSFYAGDGLNHALIKPEQVLEVLASCLMEN